MSKAEEYAALLREARATNAALSRDGGTERYHALSVADKEAEAALLRFMYSHRDLFAEALERLEDQA